jgi:hypothetical protein
VRHRDRGRERMLREWGMCELPHDPIAAMVVTRNGGARHLIKFCVNQKGEEVDVGVNPLGSCQTQGWCARVVSGT